MTVEREHTHIQHLNDIFTKRNISEVFQLHANGTTGEFSTSRHLSLLPCLRGSVSKYIHDLSTPCTTRTTSVKAMNGQWSHQHVCIWIWHYKSKSSHENHPFLESLWKNPACLPQKPGRLFLVLLRSQNTTEFLEVWTIRTRESLKIIQWVMYMGYTNRNTYRHRIFGTGIFW